MGTEDVTSLGETAVLRTRIPARSASFNGTYTESMVEYGQLLRMPSLGHSGVKPQLYGKTAEVLR
jgi:hypothetical protein